MRENLDGFPSLVYLLGRSLPGEKRPRCSRQLPLPSAEADPRIWRENFLRVTDRHCQGEGFAQCLSFGFTAFEEESRNPPSAVSFVSLSVLLASLPSWNMVGGFLLLGPVLVRPGFEGPQSPSVLWRLEIMPVGTGRGLQAQPTLRHCDMTL